MDVEDHAEPDDQSDIDDDKSVIFNPPEEILDCSLDSRSDAGSSSSQLGFLDDDDGFLEPDYSAPDKAAHVPSGGDGRSVDDNLLEIIIQLQNQLLKGYTLPSCPDVAPLQHTLSRAEMLSLQHYLAWTESHGTVKAYNAHAKVLSEATREEILSLYKVRQLAQDLTGLKSSFVDMCPKSCMAFTGDSQSHSTCSYSHNGKDCNEPRYRPQQGSSQSLPTLTIIFATMMNWGYLKMKGTLL